MSGDVAGLEKAGGRSWPEPPGKEGAERMWKEREKPPEDGVWQVSCLQGGFAVHPVAGAVAKVACRSCLSGYGRFFRWSSFHGVSVFCRGCPFRPAAFSGSVFLSKMSRKGAGCVPEGEWGDAGPA